MCLTSKPIPATYHIKREWDREGSIKKFSFASSLCPKVAKSDHFFCLQKTDNDHQNLWDIMKTYHNMFWPYYQIQGLSTDLAYFEDLWGQL